VIHEAAASPAFQSSSLPASRVPFGLTEQTSSEQITIAENSSHMILKTAHARKLEIVHTTIITSYDSYE